MVPPRAAVAHPPGRQTSPSQALTVLPSPSLLPAPSPESERMDVGRRPGPHPSSLLRPAVSTASPGPLPTGLTWAVPGRCCVVHTQSVPCHVSSDSNLQRGRQWDRGGEGAAPCFPGSDSGSCERRRGRQPRLCPKDSEHWVTVFFLPEVLF